MDEACGTVERLRPGQGEAEADEEPDARRAVLRGDRGEPLLQHPDEVGVVDPDFGREHEPSRGKCGTGDDLRGGEAAGEAGGAAQSLPAGARLARPDLGVGLLEFQQYLAGLVRIVPFEALNVQKPNEHTRLLSCEPPGSTRASPEIMGVCVSACS